MRAERHTLLCDLAQIAEAEDLEPAAVRQDRAVPVHELVQAAGLADEIHARPQEEVVRVRQDDACAEIAQLVRRDALDGCLRADRHEDWCRETAVRRMDDARARSRALVLLDELICDCSQIKTSTFNLHVSSALACGQFFAQCFLHEREVRRHARPECKGSRALTGQHALAVDDGVAILLRLREKARARRCVDDVVDEGRFLELRPVHGRHALDVRVHAERRRVDEQVRHREMVREGTVLPVKDLDLSVRRELFSEARRLGGVAHAERDAPCLGAQEAPDDGSRCAAGAEQRHFPAFRREIVLCERLHEADAVCVVASQVAIPIDNRVDRPDDAGVLIDSVELRHDGLLVRDRDVPAGKLHDPESRHRLLELIGRHRQRDVDVVEPRLFDGRIL